MGGAPLPDSYVLDELLGMTTRLARVPAAIPSTPPEPGRDRPLRVGVLGARGRLGTAVVAAVERADDLDLAVGIGREDSLGDLLAARVEVVVDVTRPDVVMDHLRFCLDHGLHVVVGTTGFDEERLAMLRRWLEERPDLGVVLAPNFSVGALLMMRLAILAAPYFESVEITELHHPDKVDAPSGTARRTAELVAVARAEAGCAPAPDATTDALDGARGASVDGVPVHSVRVRGLVAHQEVLLGGVGETLQVRHDSYDRASFGPGALAAVRAVVSRPGLTVGLEQVLDLP